ncbi:hypothetical protein ALC56_10436 [Trachymyrmex septentrionalis]|uniref:Uncharacterized protein n=1 Tax=Trachymyrmex septentrionalis TaxID=34720 RepID=A0A195F4F2_9HYME|nr:hypothetical protein ALC56_10436 [Trachymyrmex septentrionalis]
MKAHVICLAVISIATYVAIDVEFQNISRTPRVQLPASYGDLLPVNDISYTHEKPISQKIARGGQPPPPGCSSGFWVMCVSTRNGDYYMVFLNPRLLLAAG